MRSLQLRSAGSSRELTPIPRASHGHARFSAFTLHTSAAEVRSLHRTNPRHNDQGMDSVLELQRQTHEEIERYERALATVLSKPATSQQTKLSNEHHASEILDRITSRAKTLTGLYKDEEGRKRETESLSGSKADDMTEFYARLGRIKEHHLKYPDQTVGGFELELAALVDADPEDYDDENEEEDRVLFIPHTRF